MNEIKQKKILIANDEDYVDCIKFKNSLKKVIEKHPDGTEDAFAAKIMLLTEEELNQIYQKTIEKLRHIIK